LARDSAQIPGLARRAKASGVVHHVGRGLNIWSNVHVEDVAGLYRLALAKAPAGAFYFAENGEASYCELCAAIARRLALGEPQVWSFEDAVKELGWQPRHSSATAWTESELPF
jgi:nucleoside-diphosphate-sugar epimerase